METRSSILFYDGECGLCHTAVRFVLRFDRGGIFCFAPLQGSTYASLLSSAQRAAMPDSIVLRDAAGGVTTRAAAVLQILRRLGGCWSTLARLAALLPLPWLDRLYDAVARHRRRWFGRPAGWCPVIPTQLRERFLD